MLNHVTSKFVHILINIAVHVGLTVMLLHLAHCVQNGCKLSQCKFKGNYDASDISLVYYIVNI